MTTAAQKFAQRNRNTIFVEDGALLSVDEFPGDQFIMRIRSPKCAAAAKPGSFVHVSCDATLPMRRPLSIMRVEDDCIDVLYKIVGDGLRWLSAKRPGDSISVLGPIGQPFRPSAERPNTLLLGGGVGIPPMVFLAEFLRLNPDTWSPLAIFGSELPFPFELKASSIDTAWLDPNVNATMPLLESWGIPCRLVTLAGFEHCFDGYVTDLAELWLSSLPAERTSEDGSLRLRADPDAQSGRRTGRKIRPAVPGIAGRIHGLCRRRLRRLRGENQYAGWPGDEARLRGWPGF